MNAAHTAAAVAGQRASMANIAANNRRDRDLVHGELEPSSEHTPLLSTVPTRPYRRAHPHTTFTRYITIVIQAVLFWSLLYLLLLLPLNLIPHVHSPWTDFPPPHHRFPLPENKDLPLERLYSILDETPKSEKAKEWSKYYSSGQHVAGKNYSQAVWTKEKWESFGLKAEIVEYEVLLNYPTGHRLALLESTSKGGKGKVGRRSDTDKAEDEYKVLFEAKLVEDEIEGDDFTQLPERLPTFHGYSANGNVTAEFVYGGFCNSADFALLDKLEVPIAGKIVLCRYGYIFRGLKVKGAQERGAVGVILFTDPADDHPDGWAGGGGGDGGAPYPKGPGRQPSSVQRGSVQFLSIQPGDPTTPGYASKPGVPRVDPHGSTPSIPSVPISFLDAIPILKALNGWGTQPKGWKGGLEDRGIGYWTGPIGYNAKILPTGHEVLRPTKTETDEAASTVLNLYNGVEYTITPIWDVVAVINGSISNEVVVIGNHRDAWCGGAADPVSGSAAITELVRTFGTMLKKGWTPLRTIIIASWDGEEYGLVGSTEWVEEYRTFLMQNAVAYFNLDVATSGPWLDPAAAPLMYGVFQNAAKSVKDPSADKKRGLKDESSAATVGSKWFVEAGSEDDQMSSFSMGPLNHDDKEKYKGTLWEFLKGKPRTIGSGSDFTAFQDIAMIPSIDFSFRQGKSGAVYHYHSNYDSFPWMEKYGDPGFKYHVTATKLIGHMALQTIDSPIIPFNLTDYASALGDYTNQALAKFRKKLEEDASSSDSRDQNTLTLVGRAQNALNHLQSQTEKLKNATILFDSETAALASEITQLGHKLPWYKWWQPYHYWDKVKTVNKKIQFFERKFGYEDGLDGRNLFKHVIFAPGLWTGYEGAVMPGIVESIEVGNWTNVERWAEIIQKCVIDAERSIV